MSESLRDRVEQAITDRVRGQAGFAVLDDVQCAAMGRDLTNAAFAAMAGARPCVTCGKGIGPRKVERGYVQCYDCARGPDMSDAVPQMDGGLYRQD